MPGNLECTPLLDEPIVVRRIKGSPTLKIDADHCNTVWISRAPIDKSLAKNCGK